MESCRRFLAEKSPEAARRAGQAISRQFRLLQDAPAIGRPLPEEPELRELVIGFGDSGYVALYRYEPDEGAVYTLAFRHQTTPAARRRQPVFRRCGHPETVRDQMLRFFRETIPKE